MSKAICVCVGLNRVDTRAPAYAGTTVPVLGGCINDAEAVAALAEGLGYEPPHVLVDGQATKRAVVAALADAAKQLNSGDTLLLSYSGHGMMGSYTTEADPNDLTVTSWVLFDQPLADFELAATWARFETGVRIIVLSDSCHSGTATRGILRKTN